MKMLRIAAIAAVVAVTSAAAQGQQQAQEARPAPQTAQQNITITAYDFKFVPAEFTVHAGARVKITFVNKGLETHSIVFQLAGKTTAAAGNVPSQGTTTVEFTAPGPGEYTYYCPVDHHKTIGMKGRMKVQ